LFIFSSRLAELEKHITSHKEKNIIEKPWHLTKPPVAFTIMLTVPSRQSAFLNRTRTLRSGRQQPATTAGLSIHFISTRLLQLIVVSSARVNYSASAACDECSRSSHNEFVAARPRETSVEAVTLAAG